MDKVQGEKGKRKSSVDFMCVANVPCTYMSRYLADQSQSNQN